VGVAQEPAAVATGCRRLTPELVGGARFQLRESSGSREADTMNGDRPKTVRVILHIGAGGVSWAAGIITTEHRGPTTVNRRFASAHPMPEIMSFPHGVDPDIWRAYVALSEYLRLEIEQQGVEAR
jgi:hypothetical protein